MHVAFFLHLADDIGRVGWLRTLMTAASPPYRSFDALARVAIAHPDWPPHSRATVRSLGAIFGKLDRDRDLSWLTQRPQVRDVLADVLGCSVAELASEPAADSPAGEGAQRIRFRDFPAARPLELLHEPLFPGIPELVMDPARWKRVWWWAPSGSGRSLVGRWLELRDRARFVRVPPRDLPRAGTIAVASAPERAVFVELCDWQSALDLFEAPLPQVICVAAPSPPPERFRVEHGFELVRSPPLDDYLDDLLDFVAERLPPNSRFAAARTREWLRDVARRDGLLDTPGAVIGACGVLERLNLRTGSIHSLADLARAEIRARLDALGDAGADVGWLRRSLDEVLVGIAHRALTDANRPWDAPRTFDEWLELVPAEHQRGPDLEWLRLTLPGAASAIRAHDVERAARKIPPGAYRIVRALTAAGLLAPTSDPELSSLRPRFVGLCAARRAIELVAGDSPFEWGEALLRPHAASLVARAVAERIGKEQSVDDVLEIEARDSPAHVAALEQAVRSTGMLLLAGGEIGGDQLAELWDEQIAVMLELPSDIPRPRLDHPDALALEDPLLHRGVWLLALLSISEQLPRRGGRPHPLLRPWHAQRVPEDLARVFDAIYTAVNGAPPGTSWARHAFALVDRLRLSIGSVSGDGRWHALERPGRIVEELEHGVLEWSSVDGVEQSAPALDALERIAERRGFDFAAVASAIWNAWRGAGAPRVASELLLWLVPQLPADLIAQLLEVDEQGHSFGAFGNQQWQALIALSEREKTAITRHAWQSMPGEYVERALAVGALPADDAQLFDALMRRVPQNVTRAAKLRAEQGDFTLLLGVLEHQSGDAVLSVDELKPLLVRGLDDEARSRLFELLHARILRRSPDFREAFSLLWDVERLDNAGDVSVLR